MRASWRVLRYGCSVPASNMALDEALLEQVRAGDSPVLRLYMWDSPAITAGRFQSLKRTIDISEADSMNVPIVRRITGGRGILHGDDLTIAIVCSVEHLGLSAADAPSISVLYNVITRPLAAALKSCGVAATPGSNDTVRRDAASITGDCFALVASSDLVAGNAKKLGGAMYRAGEYILFQASIPLGSQINSLLPQIAQRVFLGAAAPPDTERVDPGHLSEAIIEAWAATFSGDVASEDTTLSKALELRTTALTNQRYCNSKWTAGTIKQIDAAELN
jgi:lipoate-protein ligase A